jgi:uncharacterized membrane protein
MKQSMLQFVWTTFLRGALFLATVIVTALLIRSAVQLVGKLLRPVARLFPFESWMGIATADLIALLSLIIVGFGLGLLARTQVAGKLAEMLERVILRKMPGFSLLKSAAHGMTGQRESSDLKVALANIDDAWLLAFIVETHADGMLTVFIPSAPSPTAGSIYFLTEQQVKRLDVPVATAVKCIMQLGVGSKELLEKSKQPHVPSAANS